MMTLLLRLPCREVGDVSQRFAHRLAPNHYTARSARGRTDPMTIPAALDLEFAAGDPPGDDPSRGAQRQHPAGDPGSGGRTSGGVSADFPWIYWKTRRPSIAPKKPLRALLPQAFHAIRPEPQPMGQWTTTCCSAGSLGCRWTCRCGTRRPVRRTATVQMRAMLRRASFRQRAADATEWKGPADGGPRSTRHSPAHGTRNGPAAVETFSRMAVSVTISLPSRR